MPAPKFKPNPPIDQGRIATLKKALEVMLPIPLGLEDTPPVNSYGEWKSPMQLSKEVLSLTNQNDVKDAYYVLTQWQETFTEAPQYEAPATSNIPQAGLRESQEAERAARAAAEEEAKEKGVAQTEEFLKQQQERAERLKEILEKTEKINAKVEKKAPPEILSEVQVKAIDNLKEEAVQNPKAVTEQLAQEIKNRIAKDTPPEILDNIAKQTAIDTVQALAGEPETSPTTQIAYFQAIAKNPEVVEKIVKDPGIAKEVAQTAIDLTDFKTSQLEQSRKIFASAFGEEAAKYVFADNVITVSETPAPEYTQTFSLAQIPEYHTQNLSNQSSLLDNIRGLGFDEARSRINTHLGGLIEKRIASLPEGHFLRSEFVGNTLGIFGVGPAVNWVAVEGTSPIIKFAVSSGYGPLLGTVQKFTGWNLGVSKLATPLAEKAVAAGVGKVAAGAAAKTGLAATLSTAFAALGSWAPIIGNLIGAALGWIAGKIIEKIPWKKVLPFLVGGLLLPFFGPVAAIAGGLGTALIGGATLTGIGAGIGAFFWTLGRATAITIGTPVIVTLLVFPVVVALILFIINSGAYIVPPAPYTIQPGATIVSPYIDVTKTPVPPGPFQNSNLPLTIEYQIQIRAKKGTLQNVKIDYECNVIKEGASIPCPNPEPAVPTTTNPISPAQAFTFSYKQTYDSKFQDSLIVDTITVTADVTDQSGAKAAASAGVKIGNPPDTCPSGWPISGNHTITQTPGGGFSHASIEAVDISLEMGIPVKATHSGVATVVYTSSAYRPLYIDIVSNCGGNTITTRYAHLSGTSISNGQSVTMGQTIGSSGSDGTGPHLHYEFRGLRMDLPYIPADEFIRNCSDDGGRCGTTGVKLR